MYRVLEKRGWTVAQFQALPLKEQDDLLALEHQKIELLRDGMQRMWKNSKSKDGKRYPENVIANLLVELVNVL
jgi:hypothetical protein